MILRLPVGRARLHCPSAGVEVERRLCAELSAVTRVACSGGNCSNPVELTRCDIAWKGRRNVWIGRMPIVGGGMVVKLR